MAGGETSGLHEPPSELRRALAMPPDRRRKKRNVYRRKNPTGAEIEDWLNSLGQRRKQKLCKADPPISPRFLELVSRAIEEGRVLDLVYRDRNEVKTRRRVRPLRWVDDDRFTAHCELRDAKRDFRVSRVADCRSVP